ncbi:hypothetical protein AB0N92_24995 [Streptomyces sp. NPDC093248]|uniref:hypothetical protein n=1 Tax=Streptomyces sp. NPDC093248 TaxID=3155072 RepID=UPI003416688F
MVAGPGSEPVRGPRRINTVLAGVREFLGHGTTSGTVPMFVLSQLYKIADDRDLPPEARGKGSGLRYFAKARHRAAEPDEPVGRATDEEVLALLRACRNARDRFIVLLVARAGLRRSEAVGLRREDIHFCSGSRSGRRSGSPARRDSLRPLRHLCRADERQGRRPRLPVQVPLRRLRSLPHRPVVLAGATVLPRHAAERPRTPLHRNRVGRLGPTESTPSEEEIKRIRTLIRRVETDLEGLTDDELEQVNETTRTLRKTRTVSLGMPGIRAPEPNLRLERDA